MKARILNNEFQGVYTDDFILNNLDNLINGQLVSEWQLTEILPSMELKKPIWNNSEWIEGATPEEIAEANKSKVPIQVKNMKFRLALIKSGIMPSSIDTAINQMSEGAMKENIFTLWNFADYLERNDVSLNYMAGQFNISQEQLDDIFINGNKL